MKRLYLVGGTMGVGKTTACQALERMLPRAAMLDGDWLWDADPFVVTDETKAMVLDNIRHVLGNLLRCSEYDNVIFCWVMHEQQIIDDVLSALDLSGCEVVAVSLTCSPGELARRIQDDVDRGAREPDVLDRSLARLPLYEVLRTQRLDVTGLSPEETARALSRM